MLDKADRQLGPGLVKLIAAQRRAFGENADSCFREGELQRSQIPDSSTQPVYDDPRVTLRPAPPEFVQPPHHTAQVDVGLVSHRFDLAVELPGGDHLAPHQFEADARPGQGPLKHAGGDAKLIRSMSQRQRRGGVIPWDLRHAHLKMIEQPVVRAWRGPAGQATRQHTPLKMPQGVCGGRVGAFELLGVVYGDASAPIARALTNRVAEDVPQVGGAVGWIVLLKREDRAADAQRTQHGPVAGFVNPRVN